MFKLYDLEMNPIPFPQGVWPLDIFISSIDKDKLAEIIEGVPGTKTKGYTKRNRPIEVTLRLEAYDTQDYRLLRDEVYSLFNKHDAFYIVEEYKYGIRYKVSTIQSFIPERINQRVATARFYLDIDGLPFGESIGTTQIIQQNGLTTDDDLWSYGMGLSEEPEHLQYTWEGNMAIAYNAGNESVHPFFQDLKITISNIQGSSDFFELVNLTNNTRFRVTESVSSNDTIVIDGPNVTKNGLAFLRSTTKEFIELSPGQNNFIINGATSAKVEFDFRFYY